MATNKLTKSSLFTLKLMSLRCFQLSMIQSSVSS